MRVKVQLVLLVAFPRPLSRCYPLAYLHPLLCLPYADKTSSEQYTICTFPLICRHCAWEWQATVDVQLMTKCNCKLSCCQDVIIAPCRNRNCNPKLLAVRVAWGHEAEDDESFHARRHMRLLRFGAILSAPLHDVRLSATVLLEYRS